MAFARSLAFYVLARDVPQFHEYLVVGRGLPTEKVPEPTIYRMRIFAPNALVARSKFWYFMKRLSNIKKMTGEILATTEVRFPRPCLPLDGCCAPFSRPNSARTWTDLDLASPCERAGLVGLLLLRSLRRSRGRSRTLACGSATTRGAAPTTCTRSTAS